MNFGGIRILLVEDSEKACLEFEDCMKELGGFYLVAATGKQTEAIEVLMTKRVDAIILDLELLEGDGLGFLEEMGGKIKEKPFIIVTTNTQSQTMLQAVRENGADFIYQKTNLHYSSKQILGIIKKTLKFHLPVRKENVSVQNKEYNEEREREIFARRVAAHLASMGFIASYKGTRLLREAIVQVAETGKIVQITKHVYPALAKRYGMTVNSVEKNIRTAIEQTWLNGDQMKLQQKYPYDINNDSGRPTNMNFICNMAEYLRNM